MQQSTQESWGSWSWSWSWLIWHSLHDFFFIFIAVLVFPTLFCKGNFMIEAVEKHLRDARHVATPETSEKVCILAANMLQKYCSKCRHVTIECINLQNKWTLWKHGRLQITTNYGWLCLCHLQRSGEHAESKTKRAKSSSNDGEILEARESIEEDVTRETKILEAAAPGQLPDVEGMEEDEGNYSASTLAAVQNLREQINVFTSQVRTHFHDILPLVHVMYDK